MDFRRPELGVRGHEVIVDGTRRSYNALGLLHSYDDAPAVTDGNSTRQWWYNGLMHRDSGPAVLRADGTWEVWHYGVKVLEGRGGCAS